MIEIKNLKKKFGNKVVLDGVDLIIPEGKTTVVLGFSGGGKSTIIKHIVKLLEPDSGEVFVDGKDVTKANEQELFKIRKNVGYLFQSGALFDSKNVFENVSFPLLEHTTMGKNEIKERVHELIKLVDLEPKNVENLFPDELSGGMRKRIGLARTIALNPKVVLYDEPTSGLDPITSEIISNLMLKLQVEIGVTSVLISHDMKEAFRVGDIFSFLYQGKIIQTGDKESFLNTPHDVIRKFIS